MDNRGIDQDPGWINRQFREIRQAIEAMRSERRTGSVTIESGGALTVASGGKVLVETGGSLELNLPTTSATSNVVVDAVTGVLSRSTSSRRYKQDIADIEIDPAAILKMRPRVWHDKRDVAEDGDKAPWYVGFVAEELHDAGLSMFVGYDTEGKPESVDYDRLTVALLILCRVQQVRINTLASQGTSLAARVTKLEQNATTTTARTTALETAVADLTARVTALEAPPAEPEPAPTSTPTT